MDTKEGPLSFSLSDRAKVWKEDYLSLKKEVKLEFNGSSINRRPETAIKNRISIQVCCGIQEQEGWMNDEKSNDVSAARKSI